MFFRNLKNNFPLQLFKIKQKEEWLTLPRSYVMFVNRMENRNLEVISIPYNMFLTRNLQYQVNSYLLFIYAYVAVFFFSKSDDQHFYSKNK